MSRSFSTCAAKSPLIGQLHPPCKKCGNPRAADCRKPPSIIDLDELPQPTTVTTRLTKPIRKTRLAKAAFTQAATGSAPSQSSDIAEIDPVE
jgi:hypothetical protein